MLGKTIDYYILRPFTHSRNKATEDDLNDRADRDPRLDIERASSRLQKIIRRLDGQFPINKNLTYLDLGCGTGEITLALVKLGASNVTGIDILPRNIVTAVHFAEQQNASDQVQFICDDINRWSPPHRYDVVLSHEALEHIENPKAFLQKIAQLVKPDGTFVLAFGPLFHSPFGDHMNGFFRFQFPWRGVFFSEKAILRLRRERFRPTDPATCFQEIKGGLNQMRYSEFLQYVRETGWEFEFLVVNPQLKQYFPLFYLSNILIRTPVVKDYLVTSVYTKLKRRADS